VSADPSGAEPRHLFVTQDYPPDLGGMARRHVELCRRYPAGMEVSTVAAPGAGAFDAEEPYAVHRQPFAFARAKVITSQLRWGQWLVRYARRSPVVLHCGNVRPAGYAVWIAHRRTGAPYLVYVNGLDLLIERRKARGALKRRTAAAIFGAAAGVVANSRWTAEVAAEVMREVGVRRPPPVAAIDLGTDPAQFAPTRDTGALRRRLGLRDAPVLLTVARLVPHKGHDVAIEALARLGAHGDARYLIVGTGPDEPRLRALAADRGLAGRVHFTGALPDAEVAEAYATADVYVGLSRLDGPTSVEGFGIAFVEAAASGTPSVAGDSGGVRSAVRDGETGFVVPPARPRRGRPRAPPAPRRRELRAGMGARGRRLVETHYNWERVARETADFARRALAGEARPATRTA
jgi:phosphatidylinositol alpha-1,6-mannosyltransferase